MGKNGKIRQQNPQEVSGRVRSCAVSERSGGFCICCDYVVCPGLKMIRKWNIKIFGRKLEA